MKNSTLKNIGIFSSALFVAGSAVYLYSPTIGSHADTSKSAEVSLTVGSALALSTSSDRLALEANIGDFAHGSIDVDIVTNSQYGYTLTLEDSDSESSLVHSNSSISDKLTSTFSGSKSSAEMANNTWGYSLNETNYYLIPTLGDPAALKRTTGAVSGDYDRTNVDFGAKVGNITSGTYTDTVKFTAYVNGADGEPEDGTKTLEPGMVPETRTISDITTMQEMNSKICANSAQHETATLMDIRNNENYTVAKLKDGNCWMTKNLALDNYTLTSEDSDVPANYSFQVPASSNDFQAPAAQAGGDGDFKFPAAYIDEYGGFYNFYTAAGGWDGLPQSDPMYNRYNNSPQSICPKGWRLPTGTYDGEYENLWNNYRLYANDETEVSNLMSEPVNFVLSGSMSSGHEASHVRQGEVASLWTSTNSGGGYGMALYMWVKPTSRYGRVNAGGAASTTSGYAVRCIAR